ncbi:MAG: T9SS type A sorting domain-containing protein [bacterium]|nr:T9SS type A sorting domain-containing protein [bacterium]
MGAGGQALPHANVRLKSISAGYNHALAAQSERLQEGYDPELPLPARPRLLPCFPNPFNAGTTITWELPAAADVRLRIHDLRGRLVRELVRGRYAAGRHHVTWDGTANDGRLLPAGLYLGRLETGDGHDFRSLTLLK